MHLMILENKRLRATLRPSARTVSIGSNPQCGVHLPDHRIGQHQATLQLSDDGCWWLEINEESVPTCLNRTVQKGRAKLRHADEIEVGRFSIRLFMEVDKSAGELQHERMVALSKKHGESLPLGAIIQLSEHAVTISKEHLEQLTLLGLKLASIETVRELLPPVLRAMLRLVDARRVWIGIRSSIHGTFDWALGLTDQGQPCDRPAFSLPMENRCLAHTQYVCCPEAPIPGARSAMAVPLACGSGNLGMLYFENDLTDPPYAETSLAIVSALACCVARPVENALLKSAAKRQAVASTEHTVARATQDAITPKALPQWDEIQIAAYRHMGSVRCCDHYDIVQLPDKTASIIVARLFADGIAMPRLLAQIHAAFRFASLNAAQPHLFCRALNWIFSTIDTRCAAEVAVAWLQPKTGKLSVCIAGEGVAARRIGVSGESSPLSMNAQLAIGKARSTTYEATCHDLTPGESLLLATIGADAAKSNDGRIFGINAIEETVCDGVGDRPASVLGELQTELTEFSTNGSCPDDITVVMARWAI